MTQFPSFISHLYQKRYQTYRSCLLKGSVHRFATDLMALLFPQLATAPIRSEEELQKSFEACQQEFMQVLGCLQAEFQVLEKREKEIAEGLLTKLPEIESKLSQDAQLIVEEDPAAHNFDEVVLCYPGFYAIAVYRIAHALYQMNVPLLPRLLAAFAQEKTSIDIHPGAQIASPFFIDHGTGIVIGETSVVGKNVKLFQGVTLGALSVHSGLSQVKRHPTIEDDCVLYANATILGGKTVVGSGSIVGGNVWVTKSIPAGSQVYNKNEYRFKELKSGKPND